MAKEKFKTAAVEEIGNITLYAISDNYHDRRKTPVAIFITEKEQSVSLYVFI